VEPGDDEKTIKEAYRFKVKILHPDRLMNEPETVRKRADEELKVVNQAYNVLKESTSRDKYIEEWYKRGNRAKNENNIKKPVPSVKPHTIEFRNVKFGQLKTGHFVISNTGGPYSRIWMTNHKANTPDSWLREKEYYPLVKDQADELPLKVVIEVEGQYTPGKYTEQIVIKLDEEETTVNVIMNCVPQPRTVSENMGTSQNAGPYSGTYSQTATASASQQTVQIADAKRIVFLIVTFLISPLFNGIFADLVCYLDEDIGIIGADYFIYRSTYVAAGIIISLLVTAFYNFRKRTRKKFIHYIVSILLPSFVIAGIMLGVVLSKILFYILIIAIVLAILGGMFSGG
jgi:hypothetical protein